MDDHILQVSIKDILYILLFKGLEQALTLICCRFLIVANSLTTLPLFFFVFELCSLLLEDSDEDEGDLCRICQMGETSSLNPLIEPCRCTGSLQYVHQDCIKKWLRSKISSGEYLSSLLFNPTRVSGIGGDICRHNSSN